MKILFEDREIDGCTLDVCGLVSGFIVGKFNLGRRVLAVFDARTSLVGVNVNHPITDGGLFCKTEYS